MRGRGAPATTGTPPDTPVPAPLRVVHVITSLTTGGAERQLELLANRTAHQTVTIALYDGGPVADSMRLAGHRVEVLGMDGWRKAVAPLRLAARLRRYRPDVVHVHLLAAQLWGIPAARLAGVPVVLSSEHSLMDDTIEGRPHTWWLRLVYRALERLTTHTIAVSAMTAERLRCWGVADGRITVADNGIDFDALRFSPAARSRVRAELAIDELAIAIGVVARLDPVKRVDSVLRACAPLLGESRVLIVAGAGALLPQLRALAAELGVAAYVRWLGARGDVSSVLSAVDLLVSASADETFGMAVVEALASGLPVLYAQCPAIEALPQRPVQSYQLPPPRDPESDAACLGAAIVRALDGVGPDGLGRWPVPPLLLQRYSGESAARRIDAQYSRLRSTHRG